MSITLGYTPQSFELPAGERRSNATAAKTENACASLTILLLPEGGKVFSNWDSPTYPGVTLGLSVAAKIEGKHDGYVVSSGDFRECRESWHEAFTSFFSVLRDRYQRAEEALGPSYRQLDDLLALPIEWDAYRAPGISPSAVTRAKDLLFFLRDSAYLRLVEKVRPYAVVPLSTGGVQLAWRGNHGNLEVDIEPQGSIGYFLEVRRDAIAREEEGEATPERLSKLLESVF